jgi:cell division septation protein DedD
VAVLYDNGLTQAEDAIALAAVTYPLAQSAAITLDGNLNDWPVGAVVDRDGEQPDNLAADADVRAFSFTNTSTTLSFRFDTYDTPISFVDEGASGPGPIICLNTDNNVATGAAGCYGGSLGPGSDVTIRFESAPANRNGPRFVTIIRCGNPACTTTTKTQLSGSFGLAGSVFEINVPVSELGIPSGMTTIPAVWYYDNGGGPAEDVGSAVLSLNSIAPTATATPTATSTPTPSATPTATATSTPSATPTATATATPPPATPVAYGPWTYVYDRLGNLTNKAGLLMAYGANLNATGAGPHQARLVGGQPFTYDANGNLTSGGGRTIA